jgi:uncharacterized caspase-like protein
MKNLLIFVFVCLLAIVSASPIVFGSIFVLEEDAVSVKELPPTKILIIGVGKFDNEALLFLRSTVNDADDLAAAFVGTGIPVRNITVMTDDTRDELKPTRANIIKQIKKITQNAAREEQIIIYFSGHGYDGKLVSCDGKKDDIDSATISVNWIRRQLAKSSATKKLLILDAVSGTIEDKKDGVVILAGSSAGQQCWESANETNGKKPHSALTIALIEGLKGAAEGFVPSPPYPNGVRFVANHDGWITVNELFAFVRSQVPSYVKEQYKEEQQPVLYGKRAGFVIGKPAEIRPCAK